MKIFEKIEEYFRNRQLRKLESSLAWILFAQTGIVSELLERYTANLIINNGIKHLLNEHKTQINEIVKAIDSISSEYEGSNIEEREEK